MAAAASRAQSQSMVGSVVPLVGEKDGPCPARAAEADGFLNEINPRFKPKENRRRHKGVEVAQNSVIKRSGTLKGCN
jgi:hypothetical protein